ncbi:MAG: hypothetical protein GY732_09440 [Gammaproteobacteria bacterium]|nr:hypothetical protein [Gammaproteobacteria bacterium]
MKTKVHAIAGVIGFLSILSFWTSTLFSEIFGTPEMIAFVKNMIMWGMFVLVPAMAIAGATGMSMGAKRTDAPAVAKKKRMPIIAANGLLILLPSAVFLESRAAAGIFDTWFYAIQVLELVAGAANLSMMGLNIRDGLKMTGRIESAPARQAAGSNVPVIDERDNGPLVAKGVTVLVGSDQQTLQAKPVMALCRCGASKNKPYCDGSHNRVDFDSHPVSERTRDDVKIYSGEHIAVHYNRLICSHAGECGQRLKPVFDAGRRPWIEPNNAAPEDIITVVESCPSGALRYSLPGEKPQHAASGSSSITVEKDGPYRVTGIQLSSARLAKGANPDKSVLCRCGASKNKPYCDGTHHDINWRAEER